MGFYLEWLLRIMGTPLRIAERTELVPSSSGVPVDGSAMGKEPKVQDSLTGAAEKLDQPLSGRHPWPSLPGCGSAPSSATHAVSWLGTVTV